MYKLLNILNYVMGNFMKTFSSFMTESQLITERNIIESFLDDIEQNLSEAVYDEKHVKDNRDDYADVIRYNYQSLYLHLKALNNLYTIKGDKATARRIQSMATSLTQVLDQQREFQFKK
jgi:hypothetical protein